MKVPGLLQNIYRDLRDRRMLSIAIALVVAIIAVPFLLKGPGGEEATSSSAAVPTEAPFVGDEQLDPVVLAEVPGLRDFRERLAGYSSHNPFKVQYSEPGSGGGNGGGNGSGSDSGSDSGTGTGAGGGTSDVPATVPSDSDVPASVPGDSGSTGAGGSTDPGGSTEPDSPSSGGGSELISFRIDVRVGPVGHTKVLKDVESFSFLPERKHPLVQYVDADTGGTKVAFIVNPTAAALKGNGKCIRNQKDCQYLVLEPGQERYFLFDEHQYRIELLSINEHREPYQPKSSSDGDDGAERGLNVLTGD